MLNSHLRYRLFFPLFWLSLLLTVPTYSQTNSRLTQQIDKVLKESCLDSSQTSVNVVALPDGEIVYARNPVVPLLPASVMKLVTTAAALHYLSPEYRFKTEFLYSGTRNNGLIQGDLIIRGGGNPRLSTEQFWTIATRIKASGINEITGDLIVDTHFFDEYELAPEWEEEKRGQRPYDAKLSALSLNFNTIAAHIQPGASVGDTVNAWLDPAPAYIHLRNTGKTTSRRSKHTVWAHRHENQPGEVEIEVRGQLPVNAPEKVVYLNLNNPTHYAAETFRALLLQIGIKINGETKTVSSRIDANKLYKHFSQPLSLILKELNLYSNNLTAEHIVKTIAAERYGTPGSHAEGLRLLDDFLRINNVNTEGVVIVDGSGLSRKNRMTTHAITDLLTAMYSRFDIGPDFIAALHIMGKNDIYAQRLRNSPAREKTRAKTGSLKGVSTLAGYMGSSNGQIFGFALFLNHNRCGSRKADDIEDRIITAIYNLGESAFEEFSTK